LTADHGLDPRRRGSLDQGISWIASKKIHTFALEDLADGIDNSHGPPRLNQEGIERSTRFKK
jgi:hypothetical protein